MHRVLVVQQVNRLLPDLAVPVFRDPLDPSGRKQGSVEHNLSLSLLPCPYMSEMPLKKDKMANDSSVETALNPGSSVAKR